MREEKQILLDEVKDKITGAKSFVITRYEGLNAKRAREFRDAIAEAEGDFEIVKKRVFWKASESAGIKVDVDSLQGHIGVIFSQEDGTKISKAAVKYGEDNEDAITVLGGHIEGELCSAEDIIALAKLPGIDELRSQLLGLFEAPMSQTVAVVQAALTSVLYCLDEKAKKGQ